MSSVICLLLLLFLSTALQAEQTVRIAYPSTSYTTMPLVVGQREGFFNQEGLNAELIQTRPNIGITALVNGEVEFTTTQGSVVRAAAKGMPLKSVAIIADRPVYFLVAKPAFSSIASLKGKAKKIIGVDSIAGNVYMLTKDILVRNGLNPDKDFSFIVSGDHQACLQAVYTGTIDATLVPIPWQAQARRLGLKILPYAGDLVQLPMGGIGTSDKLIQNKPDLVKKVIRATLKGIAFLREKKNKEGVVAAMRQWFKIDQEIARESYDQMILAYPLNGTTSPEVLRKDLEIIQQPGGVQGDALLSRVVDFRLLREVQKDLGLQD